MSCHILCSNPSTWVWGAPSRKECVNLWKKNTLPAVTTPTLFQLLIWRKSFMEWKVEREKHGASTEPTVCRCRCEAEPIIVNSMNGLNSTTLTTNYTKENCERDVSLHIYFHSLFSLFNSGCLFRHQTGGISKRHIFF